MAADRKLRVMITSGGGPGVWGLLYALRTLPGRRAHVIVQDPDPAETLGTLLADERACLPPAADATYIDRLLEHCRGRGVDVLVPVYDGELTAIARRRADFADAGVTLLLPPTEVVTSCADKWSLHERLAGGDLLPPHRLVRTMRETAEAIEQLGYPQQRLCVRPINLAGGRGVHFLDPTADRFAQQMLAKPGPIICTASDFLDMRRGGPTEFPLVIAEFLPGDDLGIDLLADSGRVVEMVVRRKGGALHAGNPMRMDFAQRPGEREWVARLSATLGLSGLVNVDARYDERGTLRLLEINPRPSACIGMSCAVVHLLGWAIDRALSEKCDASRYRMPEAAGAVVRAIA
jgi:carbamoyl-phosphate synthase large subunit